MLAIIVSESGEYEQEDRISGEYKPEKSVIKIWKKKKKIRSGYRSSE